MLVSIPRMPRIRRAGASVLLVALALAAAGRPGRAEHLPVRTYTTADGLASARVLGLARDRRGFLWFATQEGLSRFDGQRFETFGKADGLPDLTCTSVVEASDGVLWVSTTRGLARFEPDDRADRVHFTAVHLGDDDSDEVNTVVEDRDHVLWAGTAGGLWQLGTAGAPPQPRRARLTPAKPFAVYAIAEDRFGTLWLGTGQGVVRRARDGALERYRYIPRDLLDDRILRLYFDRAGRLWIGSLEVGLIALVPPPPGTPVIADLDTLWEAAGRAGPARGADGIVRTPHTPGELIRYTPADGFITRGVRRGICEDARGDLYFGGGTLVRFDGQRFTILGTDRGFPDDSLAPCAEDTAGNIWFGGDTAGAVRLARHGFVTYGAADGLAGQRISGISQGPDGNLYVTAFHDVHVVHRLDGDRFTAVEPRVRPEDRAGAWGWGQVGFLDRDRRWWYATQFGLARYPEVARLEDLATTLPQFWHKDEGLPGRDIWRLYQDSRGDVWVATLSHAGLARWDRAHDALAVVSDPQLPAAGADVFVEDGRGNLWIGFGDGHLAQLDLATHRVVRVRGAADGLLDATIYALLIDRAGHLWIANEGGVVRVDDPTSERLAVTTYSTATGLSSVTATALIDDARGRIYVGTNRGIDRIDPATGAIGHFTLADGLAQEYVDTAFRDRGGDLWFGSHGGLSRLTPDDPPPAAPPPVYVVELRAGGVRQPLAIGGDRAPAPLDLPYDVGAIDLALASPSFDAGQPVRFQFRLDDDAAWSAPEATGELHLAHLSPGHYHLAVRATFDGGDASPVTELALTVAAPVWQWWSVRLAVLGALGLGAWLLYRRRIAHLLALERVRTRIASDLHDDLGSSLSRIAILSELAARRAGPDDDGVVEVVDDIGRSARALVDAASDIVWSTDPRRDDLGSLLVRLRTFAGDVLEAKGVAWSLDAPADPARVALDPDARRHLFLVVKEAISNAARHADAARVTIAIRVRGARIEAIVEDDGRGITPGRLVTGNGLRNMRARAVQAGGTLTIEPGRLGGTRVLLRLPLHGPA
jgi:ligand-binding sensor domain-containing protein/signal transduction histidine kinase